LQVNFNEKHASRVKTRSWTKICTKQPETPEGKEWQPENEK